MRNKRWKAGLICFLTVAACVLSGCASASAVKKEKVKPVNAEYSDDEPFLVDDSGEYSGSCSGASSNFKEIKMWSIPASDVGGAFNEGDMFQLDCEVKGSGQLCNYFYGGANYRRVKHWYSPTTGQSGTADYNNGWVNTDGQNYIPLTSEYKHYCVRFELDNVGDGSVDKRVLFRVFSGSSGSVRNVQFRKCSKKFAGWSTKPDGADADAVWYKEGQNVKNLDKDMDLYAQWADKYADFGYTGSLQSYTVPTDGVYQLEVWGASGGGGTTQGATVTGGYGGYSVGKISLKRGQTIYVAVGGEGKWAVSSDMSAPVVAASYNGSGGTGLNGYMNNSGIGGGGGSTAMMLSKQGNGELKNYSSHRDDVLIVAGAGGGGGIDNYGANWGSGGNGGGYSGSVHEKQCKDDNLCHDPGTQTTGYAFGTGHSGGGGGWYGGNRDLGGGTGGSGYIGNSLLADKHMAGYDVATSNDAGTKTISVKTSSGTPEADKAKTGNGYARITLIDVD